MYCYHQCVNAVLCGFYDIKQRLKDIALFIMRNFAFFSFDLKGKILWSLLFCVSAGTALANSVIRAIAPK